MPDPKFPPTDAEDGSQVDKAMREEWAREQELADDPETGSASGFGQTEGS